MQQSPNDDARHPEALQSLDLVAAHVERQLDVQWELWDSVDVRLRLLLGLAGAILVATSAFVAGADELNVFSRGLLIASVVVMLLASAVTGLAWLPREFDRPPKPETLRQRYLNRPGTDLQLAVVDSMVKAYNNNEKKIDEKLGAFRNSIRILAIGVLLFASVAIIEVVSNETTDIPGTGPTATPTATEPA